MNAAEYRQHFSSNHARNGMPVTVPAGIERREGHQPCGYCGVRPDVPCRHKEGV